MFKIVSYPQDIALPSVNASGLEGYMQQMMVDFLHKNLLDIIPDKNVTGFFDIGHGKSVEFLRTAMDICKDKAIYFCGIEPDKREFDGANECLKGHPKAAVTTLYNETASNYIINHSDEFKSQHWVVIANSAQIPVPDPRTYKFDEDLSKEEREYRQGYFDRIGLDGSGMLRDVNLFLTSFSDRVSFALLSISNLTPYWQDMKESLELSGFVVEFLYKDWATANLYQKITDSRNMYNHIKNQLSSESDIALFEKGAFQINFLKISKKMGLLN